MHRNRPRRIGGKAMTAEQMREAAAVIAENTSTHGAHIAAAIRAIPIPTKIALTCTGVKDATGKMIHKGDRLLYKLEGSHTKQEYWNPEYEVIWDAPKFTLKHVGGGKCNGSFDFMLRNGGCNGNLFIMSAIEVTP